MLNNVLNILMFLAVIKLGFHFGNEMEAIVQENDTDGDATDTTDDNSTENDIYGCHLS